MAREHLTRKAQLGNEIDEETFAIGERLRAAIDKAEQSPAPKASAKAALKRKVEVAIEAVDSAGVAVAAAPAPAAPPPSMSEAGAEASQIEEDAVVDGAEILFELKKEGPITALSIILIPEEFKQNRRIAALAATFGFVAYLPGRRHVAVAVPKGYVTDFASIPGWIQWLIAPFGRHSEAAVVHDWLYTLGTKGDRESRKIADLTFRRALAIVGVKFVRRNLMYWAVRMGGASGFGLENDYDFRDLVRLKRRKPPPDRSLFAVTCRDRCFTRQEWKALQRAANPSAKVARKTRAPDAGEDAPMVSSAAPAPMPSAEAAKAEAQETMVAVEKK